MGVYCQGRKTRHFQLPAFLDILGIVGIVIGSLVLLFLAQSLIAPRLIAGTLSEPVVQTCNQGLGQWILYDCKPNALTGLGCIFPGSGGRNLTYKTVAVHNPTCQPEANGQAAGSRAISFQWQIQGVPSKCSTLPLSPGCCNFNASCTRQASYLCIRTNSASNGENQCTPEYLPAPSHFDPTNDYTKVPLVLEIPCRENYCTTS